jgi:hypothetical protein
MNRIQVVFALATFTVALVARFALAASDYPKSVPKDGEIPYGKVVYVDDGKCPKGEIKEITGGSQEKSIPRKTRCVKRPAESK